MTGLELSKIIDQALSTVEFEPPMSVGYCRDLRSELLRLAPGISAEVHFCGDKALTVRVQDGAAKYTTEIEL